MKRLFKISIALALGLTGWPATVNAATKCQIVNNKLVTCLPMSECFATPCLSGTQCVEPPAGGVMVAQCLAVLEPVSCANAYALKVVAIVHGKPTAISQACPQYAPYCVDGACVIQEPTCLDSDTSQLQAGVYPPKLATNDVSWGTLGFAKSGNEIAGYDTCKGSTYLLEHICLKTTKNGVSTTIHDETYFDCAAQGMQCVNGICVPKPPKDLCPTVEGVQTTFLYDTNGDRVPDSCVEPRPRVVDKCPDIDGVQSEFLFDLDNDGKSDSCVPVDANVCTDPNVEANYPDASIYAYGDNLHLGFCVPGQAKQVLHIICNENGSWEVDMTPCEYDFSCNKGACALCSDSDGGKNFEAYGIVVAKNANGTMKFSEDSCGYKGIYEYYCTSDGKDLYEFKQCKDTEKCEQPIMNGVPQAPKCVPNPNYCVPAPLTCSDTDGGVNWDVLGTVVTKDSCGKSSINQDTCSSSQLIIIERTCNGDNEAVSISKNCAVDEYCVVDPAKGGQCIKGTQPTCKDSDGGINWDIQGTIMASNVMGMSSTINDLCAGAQQMHEYYCEKNGTVGIEVKLCKDDEKCVQDIVDGVLQAPKCVLDKTCTDSDEANAAETFGTVYDKLNVPYPDYCEDNAVYQFKCGPDDLKKEVPPIPCANGCENGKCL